MRGEYQSPLDDIHGELLLTLDEIAQPWAASVIRKIVNAVYRLHCRSLCSC